jgi:hypothetical protein
MQFRMTYEGPLKPSGNNNRNTANKHHIRKALHPQLRNVWKLNPNLKSIGEVPASPGKEPFLQHLASNYPLQDYRFVPLVTEELRLRCGLDILYLRHGSPGNILQSDDIDNRIKTLFDALKRPTALQDLGPNYIPPGPDENPFFVLLEDDALITKLIVETDLMLEPLIGGIPDETDARLVITVTLRPYVVTIQNMGLASG